MVSCAISRRARQYAGVDVQIQPFIHSCVYTLGSRARLAPFGNGDQAPRAHTHSNRNGLAERVALGRQGLDGRGVVGEQRAGRQSIVLEREGGDVASAVVRRAFPCGDDQDLNVRAPRDGSGGLPVVGIRRVFPCVGFDARIAVVLQSFPCRDDEDLNLRAPRYGTRNGATRHGRELARAHPLGTL